MHSKVNAMLEHKDNVKSKLLCLASVPKSPELLN